MAAAVAATSDTIYMFSRVDLDTVGQNPVGLNDVEVYDVDTIPCRTYYVCTLDLNL